jgi:hypothetical protein
MDLDEMNTIMSGLDFSVLDTVVGHQLLPADEMLISRFENAIGFSLPIAYRNFLKLYGGTLLYGVVLRPTLLIPELDDDDDVFSISLFFGFFSDSTDSTEGAGCAYDMFYNAIRFKTTLPEGAVPIAESGENLFYLMCDPKNHDSVSICLPPEFDGDDPKGTHYLLAHSFAEFLHSLRKREE